MLQNIEKEGNLCKKLQISRKAEEGLSDSKAPLAGQKIIKGKEKPAGRQKK